MAFVLFLLLKFFNRLVSIGQKKEAKELQVKKNSDFELNTEDVYLDQGYLLWKHKTLGFVECVVISGESLMKTKRLAKGTTILGKIREDGHVDKKEIMTASNGNLALMRFMTFVANSPGTKE